MGVGHEGIKPVTDIDSVSERSQPTRSDQAFTSDLLPNRVASP